MTDDVLARLAALIRARRLALSDTSYTRQLLDGGAPKCAKKLGEEAVELAIAAISEDNRRVANEAADVLYHLLVLLEARGVSFDDVLRVLDGRMGTSGLAEKSSRSGQS
jgi:phosphoribosyl-ATP pyrophosphohydrolase